MYRHSVNHTLMGVEQVPPVGALVLHPAVVEEGQDTLLWAR